MASSEYLSHSAAYDYFLSNHAAQINQFFTVDQSRSLQDMLSAHHAYLFRCVYEMETHLEASIEELKSRQSKAEKEIAKINLLVENTRCNVLVVAKKLDEAINAYSGKSDIPPEHEAKEHDGDSSSPGYSDSSTLRNSPNERSRKRKLSAVSPAFLRSNVNPYALGFEADGFHADGASFRNFATLPTVTSTISPATWHSSNGGPYLSPESDDSSVQGPSPGSSGIRFPSISVLNSSAMDMGANNRLDWDAEPERHDQRIDLDSSDDEEVVAMQLFTDNHTSSPVRPLSSAHHLENNQPNQLFSSTPKSYPSSRLHLTPTPPSPPLSPQLPLPRDHSSVPPPSHDQDSYQLQVQAQTETETETQTQMQTHGPEFASDEPGPMLNPGSQPDPTLTQNLPLEEETLYESSLHPWTRSLSPLSELTDTITDPEVGELDADPLSDVPLSELLVSKREQEEVTVTSISAMTAEQLKLEEKRRKHRDRERERRRRKKLEAMKSNSPVKVNNARTRSQRKEKMTRAKETTTCVENGRKRLRSNGVGKRKKASKVTWPEMYMGDEKSEFYHKLIECDLCSCWYHYGCVGITPGDIRLDSSEIYVCPACSANGHYARENKIKNSGMTCSRPDCQNQVAPGEYFVSGIAGRKLRYDEDGTIKVLYLVKWDGYPIYEATWESADALPDPQNIIQVFEEACRREELELDTPDPILLSEAEEWRGVLAITDPPGVKVPLSSNLNQTVDGFALPFMVV